jgi:hypothetical protein
MKTITLQSNEIRYYSLDVPDENYIKVLALLGIEKGGYVDGEIDTTAIKQYPVQFPISEFFSEKLRSLCDSCDVTDEDYKLTSDDYFDDVDTEMSSYGDEEKTEESKPSLSLVSDNAKLRKI